MGYDEFIDMLAKEKFEEITTVVRDPNGSLDVHAHPFEAKALILDGDLQIRTGDTEKVYRVGDVFHICANESHSERFGTEGVRYLVGRK